MSLMTVLERTSIINENSNCSRCLVNDHLESIYRDSYI
jgi:hypothetical protein